MTWCHILHISTGSLIQAQCKLVDKILGFGYEFYHIIYVYYIIKLNMAHRLWLMKDRNFNKTALRWNQEALKTYLQAWPVTIRLLRFFVKQAVKCSNGKLFDNFVILFPTELCRWYHVYIWYEPTIHQV